jgi:molecular chaperone GrpE
VAKSAFLTLFDSSKLPACLKLRLGLIFAKYRPKKNRVIMSVENEAQEPLNQEAQENNAQETEQQDSNSNHSDQSNETEQTGTAPQQDEFREKFVRLYAEFENYRKRTNQERLDLIVTANAGLLKDMLPVLDDFDRAVTNNENLDDAAALREGFKLIQNKFKQILLSKGLKEMEAKGFDFDSDLHEAIANIPAPEEALKGKVVDDVEKGYFLNDKVLRYAKVVVGQ